MLAAQAGNPGSLSTETLLWSLRDRLAPCARVLGRGYATEAAQAALAHGHGHGPLDVPEIIAFTVPDNVPSRRVMEACATIPLTTSTIPP